MGKPWFNRFLANVINHFGQNISLAENTNKFDLCTVLFPRQGMFLSLRYAT